MSALHIETGPPSDGMQYRSSRVRLSNPASLPRSRSTAGMAFWSTMRKVVVIAGCVDVLFFALFLYLGVPELAWPNVSSVVLYATAYALIRLRVNALAIVLIWVEVVLHAAAGTLLIGWESGFHYYLLLFVPAIAIGSERRYAAVLLPLIFLCYLGLDICSYLIGATNPIHETALAAVRWINIAIVFTIFAYASVCYSRQLRHAEENLRFTATHDPLTGLANPHHFMVMVEHEVARQRRSLRPISIVIAGIDGLKQRNQAFGREACDRFVAEVGHMLRKNCRLEDIVCRWGPDEFAILMPETPWQRAALVAERIVQAAASTSEAEGLTAAPACSISFGVSGLLPHERFHDAFTRADSALQRSKLSGRDRVTCEPPDAAAGAGRPSGFDVERAASIG